MTSPPNDLADLLTDELLYQIGMAWHREYIGRAAPLGECYGPMRDVLLPVLTPWLASREQAIRQEAQATVDCGMLLCPFEKRAHDAETALAALREASARLLERLDWDGFLYRKQYAVVKGLLADPRATERET